MPRRTTELDRIPLDAAADAGRDAIVALDNAREAIRVAINKATAAWTACDAAGTPHYWSQAAADAAEAFDALERSRGPVRAAQPHTKPRHGRCPICGHYGDDCTGSSRG